MNLRVEPADLQQISPWRDIYRQEMNCQIIHDSIHIRPGWTLEYCLEEGGRSIGYGSVAVAGPWKDKPTIFEFFVVPQRRSRFFESFEVFRRRTGARFVETQSNDLLLTALLHTYASQVTSEAILFHDKVTTSHLPPINAHFRRTTPEDCSEALSQQLDPQAGWGIEIKGKLVAAGDILFHYNRPYGDLYMKVAEAYRRQCLGTFLVQELKRVCYEAGNVPAARCNTSNIASRKTLQKAGFAPCGHLLTGSL